MEMNTDRERLLMKAAQEDGCVVSAGTLLAGNPISAGAIHAGNLQPTRLALFSVNAEPIVTIHFDGRVTVNPNCSLDEAALAFWDAVRRMAPTAIQKETGRYTNE